MTHISIWFFVFVFKLNFKELKIYEKWAQSLFYRLFTRHSIICGYKESLIDLLLRNKRQTGFLIIIAFSDCRKMHSISLTKKKKKQEKKNFGAFLCPLK